MNENKSLLKLLARAMELAMPNLRNYYKMTRKAKVVASYASAGQYYADIQPLRNDESPDPSEPVIPRVEIPIFWGGPKRGIVCPPAVGTLCDLSYYDGDPNYPRVSNFRWQGNSAPDCELEALIIQQEPGVSVKIDPAHNIITLTPATWRVEVGGNVEIKAGGNATVEAAGTLTIQAPQIVKKGNENGFGADGGIGRVTENVNQTTTGSLTVNGPLTVNGGLTVSGDSSVAGNSFAGSRSGGRI